jgi:hypothetical protein
MLVSSFSLNRPTRQRRPRDVEGAEKVGRELSLDITRGRLFEEAEESIPGVVHQHVDPAKSRHGSLDRGPGLVCVGDIEFG